MGTVTTYVEAALREQHSVRVPQTAVSAALPAGRHDLGLRRKSQRRGRERGCWVYIAAEELQAAGIDPHGPPPFYKIATYRRSRNGSTAIVSLYREP